MMSCDSTEDFSPIYVGDTGAPFDPRFLHKDGTAIDLTGATLSMRMQNENTNAVIVCTGTWTIDPDQVNNKGLAHYAYASGDVATAGMYFLQITITITSKPLHTDIRELEIKAVI